MANGTSRHAAGFSLVELMVALAIGGLAILALLQLSGVFEGDKRVTTGGADAQNNGALALNGLQRDIRQGGYGTTYPSIFTCNISLPSGGTVPVAPVVINPAASIIPAGDANTDTLLVIYGNANWEPQGNDIIAIVGQTYKMQMVSSFAVGDNVIAAPDPGPCTGDLLLRPVSAIDLTAKTITAATGTGSLSLMFNLGVAPSVLAYAIRDGNLTVCNYMQTNCGLAKAAVTASAWAAAWVPIASNVVSLRAQYGVDTNSPMDAVVDTYNQTTPTTACGWAKLSAVRLALVARSGQYNKVNPDGTNVTPTAPVWDGSADAPIDLSGKSDWNHYRYRLFQTVVPIRNMVWLGAQTGC